MSRLLKLVLILFIVVIGVVFHLRNDQPVMLDYLLGNAESYFSIWIVAALFIGALLGMASSLPLIIKLKGENVKLQRQVKVTEKEINNLRVIPVKDTH